MKANELSCKDLMVGDWVKPHVCDSALKPSKIVGIQYNSYRGKDYVDWVDCEVWDELSLNDIEPIPLTPEILEKNEFKRDPLWHHCDKDFDNYSISIQLGYVNRIEYIEIKEKCKDNFVPSKRTKLYFTHIQYVHELQQAMRLLGIEKEIIL